MELNKIYNENCLDTMARMPDGFVDLVVTSPPYDNLRTYNGYSFDFEAVAKELFRVMKMGGVVVWVVADSMGKNGETLTSFKQALYFQEIGFFVHDTMIYSNTPPPRKQPRYEQGFEYMFVLSKGRPSVFNRITRKTKTPGSSRKNNTFRTNGTNTEKADFGKFVLIETTISNVWHYDTGFMASSKDTLSFQHPAIFPEQLAADHIFSWSNDGDLVYDPFGGSGTTAKMAHLQNRKWIISEISGEYCELSRKRIEPYLLQGSLFTSYNGV